MITPEFYEGGKMILFINTCVRADSRTKRLADLLISKLNDTVSEVLTSEITFPEMDEEFLNRRDRCIETRDFSDPLFRLAKEFAAADTIVIAAPFWDLSFPASLKQYFEQINIPHVTFYYDDQGVPRGLCRAKKLYYVTTAGGPIFNTEYGFGYIRELARTFYGIPEIEMVRAEGLDIIGADVEGILREAEDSVEKLFLP